MSTTSIQWTDRTVNPIRARLGGRTGHHCVKVSAGCANCYASKMQVRFGMPPFEVDKRQGVEMFFDEARLEEVLTRKKPTRFFWCDMTDLFGDWVPDVWIDRCFAVMALTPQHTHQILTKRPERMREYFSNPTKKWTEIVAREAGPHLLSKRMSEALRDFSVPLVNLWLGVSVENKKTRDERVPLLLKTPAAVKMLSIEPLLEDIADDEVFSTYLYSGFTEPPHDDVINWVIVGGESGASARPCDVAWIRSLVQQAKAAGVACFVKQLGAHIRASGRAMNGWPINTAPGLSSDCSVDPPRIYVKHNKGGDPSEWAEDLRVREWPAVSTCNRSDA
jgi:protein gp37